ncbi:MAG TPA: hypothetical protein VEW28_01315 [Candidatus Kapabacteria bacterium]|nr:hypothetical protein [Candidatus Kapabacteria bacterium]
MDFDSEEFTRQVMADAIAQVRANIESAISTVICPVHHQRPTLIDNYGDPEQPFSVRACCEECKQLAQQAIEWNQ